MGLIPVWAYALLIVAAWGSYGNFLAHHRKAELENLNEQIRMSQLAAQHVRKQQERETATIAESSARSISAARARGSAAATELGRLRIVLAAGTPASSPTSGGVDDSSVRKAVVDECAGALQEVAEHAESCSVRLRGLQAWARAVAPLP